MKLELDVSEAVALLCQMGDAIFAKEKLEDTDPHSLMQDKLMYNGIAVQVNRELPEDERYSVYPVE